MKRITVLTVMLACGLLATSTRVLAQATPPSPESAQAPQAPKPAATTPSAKTPDWLAGNVNLQVLGRDNVASSKFEEYRSIPQGASMPLFSLTGRQSGNDFALFAQKIKAADQRYSGRADLNGFAISFDYNQTPHNMGNNAQTIFTETAPGVWTMNSMLRQSLGAAVDAVPATATARSYPFYAALLGPTIATAGSYDVSALRKRGEVTFDLGGKLPFDLALTYNRDVKTGYRGASAGDILGVVTTAVDVLEPLNEVTQDFGVRWGWDYQKKANLHASFNRNVYNDRIDALVIDNPFRATDAAYVSTSVPGGPAQARFSTSPDNEASRGAFGAQFKFARQTRISADMAFGRWTQNAPFLPYTINSVIATPNGLPANSVATLQQQSLDGRIDTASYNVTFFSRPVDRLGVRLRYRNYEYKDKSRRFVITGDTSESPDRSWSATDAPTEENPYGHPTANRTDASNGHFEAQATYDVGPLTLEGTFRNVQTSWVGRTASSGKDGKENGYTLAAVYRTNDFVDVRFHFDDAKRTVSGLEAGTVAANQGVMADHAERHQTRVGADIEVTPIDKFGVTFGYNRRNDDYPNRPFEVAGNPATESGLLKASYDMFSVDFDIVPSTRAEISAFYSYEKVAETNQWVTLTSGALNNVLTYAPYDKGHTYGLNSVFHLVPEKWTFSLLAQHQYVNGFLDITAREAGAFYTSRATVVPPGTGGAVDIGNYDDMKQTTGVAELGYTFAKNWTFNLGYAYDKYTTADAFSDGTTIFPQAVLFFLKANDGNYTAKMAFTRLTYRW